MRVFVSTTYSLGIQYRRPRTMCLGQRTDLSLLSPHTHVAQLREHTPLIDWHFTSSRATMHKNRKRPREARHKMRAWRGARRCTGLATRIVLRRSAAHTNAHKTQRRMGSQPSLSTCIVVLFWHRGHLSRAARHVARIPAQEQRSLRICGRGGPHSITQIGRAPPRLAARVATARDPRVARVIRASSAPRSAPRCRGDGGSGR